MDKKTLLALGLILLVWIVWFKINPPVKTPPKKEPAKTEETETGKKEAVAPEKARKKKRTAATVKFRKKSAGEPKEVTTAIESEKYIVTLTNKGASVKSVKFKERKDK